MNRRDLTGRERTSRRHGIHRRHALLALATAGVVATAGCGLGSSITGVHAPPAEVTTAAPLEADHALEITERVLAEAGQAAGATGDRATTLRRSALTGGALAVAQADTRLGRRDAPASNPVTKPEQPKVLAVSRGTAWPRFILAQTTRDDGTPVLNLLTSTDARTPFRLSASAPMQPNTSVAALNALDEGSPVLAGAAGAPQGGKAAPGVAADPAAVLDAYAAAMTYPKPTPSSAVDTDDPFATTVRANAAAQAKELGRLASLSQQHRVLPAHTVSLALRDGGAIVFGLLQRTDTMKVSAAGQALTPSADFQRLTRKKKLAQGAELRTYETVVLTVPESGKAQLVAADEALFYAEGE